MRATFLYAIVAVLLGTQLDAKEPRLCVVVHPDRKSTLTVSELRAIYLKKNLFWEDNRPVIPLNRAAGTIERETFSRRVLDRSSAELAEYWNRRYFTDGEFPPVALASDEAVIRYVAANPDAIGYTSVENVNSTVRILLTLE